MTNYQKETEADEKTWTVLPSDNNSPNRTDYPRDSEEVSTFFRGYLKLKLDIL